MKRVYADARSALGDVVKDGMTLMVGGFGLCGTPEKLIEGIEALGVRNLTCISNNAGVDGLGLGRLLRTRQIRKMVASYVGENKEFERQYLAGELEVEFCPQGTLAERCRAGGAGIPAFYTRTGIGTVVEEGEEVRRFEDVACLLVRALRADVSLVKAWKADEAGNLILRKTARNFNQPMAAAGHVCVAEVEEVLPAGRLDPDHVHIPGIFVDRLLLNPNPLKRIEFRTVRSRKSA